MTRPLLSLLSICYNQESFIREAVDGALAQIYSPLEIIFMDDHSQDRTFDIVQEMVAYYRGPHSVKAFRNPSNLGVAGNFNRAVGLCHGELVVIAEGDDVSLPDRVETIYRVWNESGRQATAIFSSYILISASGEDRGIGGTRGDPDSSQMYRRMDGDLLGFLTRRTPMVNGCTAAWSPVLFNYSGPVRSNLVDVVLNFRTLAIGQLVYINKPLVKWRRHGDNVSFLAGEKVETFERREKRLRWVDESTVKAFDDMSACIGRLFEDGRISANEYDRLKAEGRRMREHYRVEGLLLDENLQARLLTLADTAIHGYPRCALRLAPRLLPKPLYRALYMFREKRRSASRLDLTTANE
jgi:glycosyltransferase involved in cell wall biosynthesis